MTESRQDRTNTRIPKRLGILAPHLHDCNQGRYKNAHPEKTSKLKQRLLSSVYDHRISELMDGACL